MDIKQLEAMGFTRQEVLAAVLGQSAPATAAQDEASTLIGQVCVCRSRGAGVHVGKVLSVRVLPAGMAHVVLEGSHRLWSWTIDGPGVGMHGVANYGLRDGKVEATATRVELFEVCEAVICEPWAWQKIQQRAQ